jgi:hypothetical protein
MPTAKIAAMTDHNASEEKINADLNNDES